MVLIFYIWFMVASLWWNLNILKFIKIQPLPNYLLQNKYSIYPALRNISPDKKTYIKKKSNILTYSFTLMTELSFAI